MVRRILIGCLFGAAVCAAACGNSDSATLTEPDSTESATFLEISGTIYPTGTHVRPFATTQFGTITVTLLSSGGLVGFGVGVYTGGSCYPTVTRNAVAPSQLAIEADQSTSYCAIVYDVTNGQTTYSLRVDYP